MKKKDRLLRISQLAKKADVSASTIKHYVKEGLIPRPIKTSSNMAYYDEDCIEKIKLVKKIQKEKFLPLDIIKRLIDSGESYPEELELGKAILKSEKESPHAKPVAEQRVASHTGYPLEKIQQLEEDGLIFPSFRNGIKQYDDGDCRIIETMKLREDMGMPFDYSLETIRAYRDAIVEAVNNDIRIFIRNYMGDVPTKQAIELITRADEAIDTFLVVFRYKVLRHISEGVFREIGELPQNLATLTIFPIEGKYLPQSPPENIFFRMIYYFCKGQYETVVEMAEERLEKGIEYESYGVAIIADLLNGKMNEALERVEMYIPKPSALPFDNVIAVIVYMFHLSRASGFSSPMYYAKKVLSYLKRAEPSEADNSLIHIFSLYVCGSIYLFFPEIVETRQTGIRLLSKLDELLGKQRSRKDQSLDWLDRTLDFEVFPALEVRINRFLAEAYLKQEKFNEALIRLERIIEIADAESEHSLWARMNRLKIKK
ncbi:MAG: MerR family transcriptional regulator [Desulfobacterales bacterium]